MGRRVAGVEIWRHDSVHPVSGRRPEDDLRLVQGRRRERVDTGQRDDSGQYLGLPLRGALGTVGPRRVAPPRRRVHGADLRPVRGPARGSLRRGQREQPRSEIRQYRQLHHPVGQLRLRECEFPQPDRRRLRREGRRVGRRYEQPPRPEVRRQAGRLPHEVRLARQRRRASSTPHGVLPWIACAGTSTSSTAPTSACRNST